MKLFPELKPARTFLFFTAICFCGTVFGADETNPLPKVFYADPRAMADAKAKLDAGDTSLKPALEQLLKAANKALALKPPSVMDKKRIPPSGDKHDYISQAPYYWRDTNSPDGKYIRRDGERNPESNMDSDAGRLGSVCSNVSTLALAFYFTGDEKYAAKAAEILRVFFLAPATKMNPNLNFGQGIPGQVDGRPTGLIGARGFVQMMDGLSLLENSKSWTAADQSAMREWMSRYFIWLTTSKIGIGEFDAKNNHGSFYDDQAAAIALFLGKTNFARTIILEAETNRIARQIEPDGRQPLELARTKSFGYSSFNLHALIDLAGIGQNLGIDLWHYQAPGGGSIYRALAFMAPFADPKLKWPYRQIQGYNHDSLADLLLRAVPEYPDAKLADALKFYSTSELATNRVRLLFRTAEIPNTPPEVLEK
ncbi:MAG TPA: alginate lyase family protein [Candidatus Aquilonibacter sp.]|nr:alginate lyase family protein [Candidatus Aquilonibacter sp.]